MQNTSVNIHYVRVALGFANQHGIDQRQLLAQSRIPPTLLELEDCLVSGKQYADLQQAVATASGDELAGSCPYPLPTGSWSALCHWLIEARTLGHALRRFCHFFSLIEKGFDTQLAVKGSQVMITLRPWGRADEYQQFAYELFSFSLHRLLCWLVQEKVPLTRVDFPFTKPDHAREYRFMYFGYPIVFNQSVCRLHLDKSTLNLVIQQNARSLGKFLQHPLYEFICQDYDRSSWSAKVREVLHSHPARSLSLDDVATMLETPPYTLRRRLKDEGQSYIAIKSQVKRDLAIHLLATGDDSMETIAAETGFSEASSFIRAFRQWTGVTPYTYRKGQF